MILYKLSILVNNTNWFSFIHENPWNIQSDLYKNTSDMFTNIGFNKTDNHIFVKDNITIKLIVSEQIESVINPMEIIQSNFNRSLEKGFLSKL